MSLRFWIPQPPLQRRFPGVYIPQTDLNKLNTTERADQRLLANGIDLGTGSEALQILSGDGTPEGAVDAPVGSIYTDKTGGTVYIRDTLGAGNTGWLALRTVDPVVTRVLPVISQSGGETAQAWTGFSVLTGGGLDPVGVTVDAGSGILLLGTDWYIGMGVCDITTLADGTSSDTYFYFTISYPGDVTPLLTGGDLAMTFGSVSALSASNRYVYGNVVPGAPSSQGLRIQGRHNAPTSTTLSVSFWVYGRCGTIPLSMRTVNNARDESGPAVTYFIDATNGSVITDQDHIIIDDMAMGVVIGTSNSFSGIISPSPAYPSTGTNRTDHAGMVATLQFADPTLGYGSAQIQVTNIIRMFAPAADGAYTYGALVFDDTTNLTGTMTSFVPSISTGTILSAWYKKIITGPNNGFMIIMLRLNTISNTTCVIDLPLGISIDGDAIYGTTGAQGYIPTLSKHSDTQFRIRGTGRGGATQVDSLTVFFYYLEA